MSAPQAPVDAAPVETFRVNIIPDTKDKFFNQIRAFAKSHGFNLRENSDPATPIGPRYVFDLDRADVRMFCANRIKDTGPIDPNGHTGAPPPTFDPLDYDISFYNKANTSGKSSEVIDGLMRAFTSDMANIKGARISSRQ